MNKYYLFSVILVFISSLTQVLLKVASGNKRTGIMYFIDFRVILSYVVMLGISLINTKYIYKELPLSAISSIETLSYVFVSILSYLILKESLSKKKAIGIILIIFGIILFNFH